ncbi:hypothetical protein, partial [uncultured Deinococcus sp.]|uniref:hypothetical protein n=1 Tax=uncultured Deinococcus sp. TaxID=158789 RepID=UPI0025FAC1F0
PTVTEPTVPATPDPLPSPEKADASPSTDLTTPPPADDSAANPEPEPIDPDEPTNVERLRDWVAEQPHGPVLTRATVETALGLGRRAAQEALALLAGDGTLVRVPGTGVSSIRPSEFVHAGVALPDGPIAPTRTQQILRDLISHPDSTLLDVAERLGVASASINPFGAQLVKRGYATVDRNVHPQAYRVTPAGREKAGGSATETATPDADTEDDTMRGPQPPPGPDRAERRRAAAVPPAVRQDVPAKAPKDLTPAALRLEAHLKTHGPALSSELSKALEVTTGRIAKLAQELIRAKRVTPSTAYRPVYRITGDTRLHPSEQVEVKPVLTQQELHETMRQRAAAVLACFDDHEELSEAQIAKATRLDISHIRASLQHLIEIGQLRRLDGVRIGMRAVYRRDTLDFPVSDGPLSPEGERLERTLREATLRNEAQTVPALVMALGLPRDVVEEQLGILHGQGRLRWRRIGHLPVLTLILPEAAA